MRDVHNIYSRFLAKWRLQCIEVERFHGGEIGWVRWELKEVKHKRKDRRKRDSAKPLCKIIQDAQQVRVLVLAWAWWEDCCFICTCLAGNYCARFIVNYTYHWELEFQSPFFFGHFFHSCIQFSFIIIWRFHIEWCHIFLKINFNVKVIYVLSRLLRKK